MKRAVGLTRFIVGIGSLSSLVMAALLFVTAALIIIGIGLYALFSGEVARLPK